VAAQERIQQLDALLRSGALTQASYAQARERMNAPALASIGRMSEALNALLDLHLIHLEPAYWPEGLPHPTITAQTRRALTLETRLDIVDTVRRWLIHDLGVDEAKLWGMWGEEVEEAPRS